jgi:phospholipid/cholesterol/gamma-HCH transport system substrate-binding protein
MLDRRRRSCSDAHLGGKRVPDAISDTTAVAAPAAASPSRRRGGRRLALGALLLALAALLFVLLTRDDSYGYRFVFQNAGQLVRGDVVRIGGTPAGEVTGIELGEDSRAEVEVSVDKDFAPLHQGTRATIRATSLIGIANRYVDIHPGPNFRPELEDGAVLDSSNTTSIVELDQFFNALDPPTRRGLEGTIQGFADWYEGKEAKANQSARYFAPSIVATTNLLKELNRDSRTFEQFLVETSNAMGALADRRSELTDLVGNAGTTARAIASDTESLSLALSELPPAMRQGSDTFAALRPALDDLERLWVETRPVAPRLGPFFRRLRPFTERSVPTFRQLRKLINKPGAANDLYDAMRELPAIARVSRRALPRSRRALRVSTPMFGFSRPYVPDLTAWLRSFGGAMAPYDANGHYARAMAVFDAFHFVDDPLGGHLLPKPPAGRGKSPYLRTGNLRRCPGSAAPSPADGSAPFVDSGELANPDCDPSQAVGAAP